MQSFTTKIKTQKTTVFYYIRVFTFLVYFSIRLYIYIYIYFKKKKNPTLDYLFYTTFY